MNVANSKFFIRNNHFFGYLLDYFKNNSYLCGYFLLTDVINEIDYEKDSIIYKYDSNAVGCYK